MIDLKQKELAEWEGRNFPDDKLKAMSKEQLISMIRQLQSALGMAEEVGEICHHVLKASQGIREGINGIDKIEVADGVADVSIYGTQLLSKIGMNAENEISKVTSEILKRDWKRNPNNGI